MESYKDVRVYVVQSEVLNEVCRALAYLRKDQIAPGENSCLPFEEYIKLVNKGNLDSSIYQRWGTKLFNAMICAGIMNDVGIQKNEFFKLRNCSLYESPLVREVWDKAFTIREQISRLVEQYRLFKQINVVLVPVPTCPPPLMGRFGASVSDRDAVTILLGFGCPPVDYWPVFGMSYSFFVRGAIHYIIKEWLIQFVGIHGFQIADAELRRLRRMLHVLLVSKLEGVDLENTVSESVSCHERQDIADLDLWWEAPNWDTSVMLFIESIKSRKTPRRLNSSCPPPTTLYRALRVAKVVVTDYRMDPQDLHLSSLNGVLRFEYDPTRIDGVHVQSFDVIPWTHPSVHELCLKNGITIQNGIIRTNTCSIPREFAVCLIIDVYEGNRWRLVLICPDRTEVKIHESLLTNLHKRYAIFDAFSGSLIE